MNKTKIAAILTLLMAFVLVGSALAQVTPVTYDDTTSDYDPPGDEPQSLILNGDFNTWSSDSPWVDEQGVDCAGNQEGNSPDYWCVWGEDKAGWEFVHLGQTDLAEGPAEDKGDSYGMSLFIRHQGNGTGDFYAGAWQKLDGVTEPGYYFINLSESIWYDDRRETASYNSVAWYTISDTDSPWDSDDWRELDAYEIQCPNSYEVCNYAGRDETIWLEPGQYLHLVVSHQFPVFNASTVFLLDDASLVPADDDPETNPNVEDYNGFYDWYYPDGSDNAWDDKCHWDDEDCTGVVTIVEWNQDAPR